MKFKHRYVVDYCANDNEQQRLRNEHGIVGLIIQLLSLAAALTLKVSETGENQNIQY